MRKFLYILLCSCLLGCTSGREPEQIKVIDAKDYTLLLPEQPQALLVLFPGFGGDAASIRAESKIVAEATGQEVAVLLMNFNGKLFLSAEEKEMLFLQLRHIIEKHNLSEAPVYFGGMSSGGNVALLLAAHLLQEAKAPKPAGIFVVDAPVDLVSLYWASERIAARNFSESAVAEARFLLNYLLTGLGHPDTHPEAYRLAVPYTHQGRGSTVIKALKNTPIRFYTEPDLEWHRQNRGNSYEDLNALQLKNMHQALQAAGNTWSEYLTTKERGYRANGERHPHSWSIVDEKELLRWMFAQK